LRGIDVLAVQEDGYDSTDDPLILDRAVALGRAMFTQDTDFLVEVARRQSMGELFASVFFSAQDQRLIGRLIADLEYAALAGIPTDLTNQLYFLPF
jgi:hypothetical protein